MIGIEFFVRRLREEMIERFDTYFYVGTVRQHPSAWIIVGFVLPSKTNEPVIICLA